MARALEGQAEVALVEAEFERAARLLSAARTTRLRAGAVLTPAERPDHHRVREAVLAGLGESRFAEAWKAEWDDEVVDVRQRPPLRPA